MRIIALILFSFLTLFTTHGQKINSVLSEGEWIKLSMIETGMYELSGQELQDAGLEVIGVESSRIQLFGNGNKILPQPNSDSRPQDLNEIPYMMLDGGDGIFDGADKLVFYANDPHELILDDADLSYSYENNIYTDTTNYFLVIGSSERLEMGDYSQPTGSFTSVSTTDQFVVDEADKVNFITSGREWYGERVNTSGTVVELFAEGLVSDDPVEVTVSAMGRTFAGTSFSVGVNDVDLGEISIGSVTPYIYGQQGRESSSIFSTNQITRENLDFSLSYGDADGVGYLNYILVKYQRELSLQNPFLQFSSTRNLAEDLSFRLSGVSPGLQIWEVTDPQSPLKVDLELNGDIASVNSIAGNVRQFIAFDAEQELLSPVAITNIANQDVHGSETPELMIVTDPEFKDQAERLAQLRETHDGIKSAVFTTYEIYNEFSSGSQDITAIRDAARYFYQNPGESNLKYLLLLGRASYDYKDQKPFNTNQVPTYQSRNNLHKVLSYSSDDYYGFMEEDEGEWTENFSGDHTMDIAVGRLPVKDWSEARGVVDKLIRYSTNERSLGNWRNVITFVADDEDQSTHQRQADQIAVFVDSTARQFKSKKIYVDAYEQILRAGGAIAPEVNEEIDLAIEEGSFIINFTGHGGERGWTEEAILDLFMIDQWENLDKMPLFVTATCEFGRFDNPDLISGGEKALLNNRGGAIGLVTTTRPVASSTNFILNKAFYRAALEKVEGRYKRLGDIFKDTKNTSQSGSSNRNFSLLGDPSMKLGLPDLSARITSVNGKSLNEADTLNAFETISMTGEIFNDFSNEIDEDFRGTVDIEIFDSPSEKETLGNQTPVMSYTEWDNAIYRGKASVTAGTFEFEFKVPKNISYKYQRGRVNLYAYPEDGFNDAAGGTVDISVGGSIDDFEIDSEAPAITLFMEDSTFIDGGLVGSNARLVAYFNDPSGMNVSQRGIGQNMVAVLDGNEEFEISQYYTTLVDDFTTGVAVLQLRDLSQGMHTITVRGFDTQNNGAEATINFRVEDSRSFIVEKLRNYPNPFRETTEFAFSHNRAGEDLDVILQIFSTRGDVIKETKWSLPESPANVKGLVWDGRNTTGKKLSEGIYFYRLVVRSSKDGAKTQDYQKLVLIN